MSKQIYLGIRAGLREIFRWAETPTVKTHGGIYNAVIGPFRTMRGARFMRDHGQGNPHCRCVREAERLARHYAKSNPTMAEIEAKGGKDA